MQVTLVVHETGVRVLAVRNNGPETAIGVAISTNDPAALYDSPVACRTPSSIAVDDLGAGEEWSFTLLPGSDENFPELFHLTWVDGAGYNSERFVVPSIEFRDDTCAGEMAPIDDVQSTSEELGEF